MYREKESVEFASLADILTLRILSPIYNAATVLGVGILREKLRKGKNDIVVVF